MNIDLRHLRCFLAVAEEGGFTAAGRRLHLAQPTLTRNIRTLEESLGVRLFERTTRRTELTNKGTTLLRAVAPLLRQLESALKDVQKGEKLRIGFSWGLPEGLSRIAARFGEATGVGVEFTRCETPQAGLDTGQVHLGLLRGAPLPKGLRGVLLYEESRIAAVPASWQLAERTRLDWAELASLPLVINTVSGTTFPEMWPVDSRPTVGAECRNVDEWLEQVAVGLGVGTAPVSAARRYTHPFVRLVPLTGAPTVPVYLAHPSHGAHPQAARFADRAWRATDDLQT
ncbi:LysR family transcriptional regulator [Streptomyces sp. NBC_01005]|uniref:LysR family transcriptional regulator n=1 Tax=unclassified Streptomyces TaxID=2593676 RepID=UPI002259B267|nr:MULTISPECIES: LysR family transcriptional regulator [unclassified Streptomyces]WSW03109.1 LysR family transcriptional regulator [Streptomyces sp. NBC_01005]WTB60274.1 LysR family transcriptional regulator [Streptomyces sp. NBC_00826]WTC92615.1 LysR family transcriptional regulator [Streptomyces sp. NBC_01650]MCX4902593.1 LysR family transcriptional regulator [Streptomyces sp. NBC_00892]WTB60529.1 LysR family transcriptional regulator [Streptomyces sp. NBC_00826]